MFINKFDPVAFQIFTFEIRWYSLAYIFGILLGYLYCKKKLIRDQKVFEKLSFFLTSEEKLWLQEVTMPL